MDEAAATDESESSTHEAEIGSHHKDVGSNPDGDMKIFIRGRHENLLFSKITCTKVLKNDKIETFFQNTQVSNF